MYRTLILCLCCLVPGIPLAAQTVTLEGAVDEALANNPSVRRAEAAARAARALVWAGFPENPELFREWEGPGGVDITAEWAEMKTGLIQRIEFPLTYVYRLKSRGFAAGAEAAEAAAVRNRIAALVKKRFFRSLLLEERTRLYEEIARITRDHFAKARIRVLSGESPPYDTLKIRVDLSEAENRLLAARENRELALQALAEAMGRRSGDGLAPAGELHYRPTSVDTGTLERLLLESHPEITAERSRFRQSRAALGESWSRLLPSFSLRMFRHDVTGAAAGRGLEIGMQVPLWFFVNDQSRIRSDTYAVDAARSGVLAREQSLLLGLRTSLAALHTADNQARNFRDNTVVQVRELVRIASRSYEAGEMGYLELADALTTMNRVMDTYFESLYTLMASRADLEEAVGTSLFTYFGGSADENL
ncbi:TolC family protein [bacterium]|nr:TolC family protein [bacterium]